MKALVLTHDRCRRVTEHMLKTYAIHWPNNQFIFRIPYQQNRNLNAYGLKYEFIQTNNGIKDTVIELLKGLPDDEWIYWCMDDKFLIAIDQESATYFTEWVEKLSDPKVGGVSFCRARRLFLSNTVDETPAFRTERGDALLLRRNYNQIWLHQFLKVRVVRHLFESFPDSSFIAREMDKFKDAMSVPLDSNLYVTEKNYVVFGESTIYGKLTQGCLMSMQNLSIEVPEGIELIDKNVVIGSLGSIVGS